jgi:hypothetical protein
MLARNGRALDPDKSTTPAQAMNLRLGDLPRRTVGETDPKYVRTSARSWCGLRAVVKRTGAELEWAGLLCERERRFGCRLPRGYGFVQMSE